EQGALAAGELRERLLERLVRAIMPADQVRRAAAGAVARRAVTQGAHHARVIRKSEIIVAAEGDAAPAVDRDVDTLGSVEALSGPVKTSRALALQILGQWPHAIAAVPARA